MKIKLNHPLVVLMIVSACIAVSTGCNKSAETSDATPPAPSGSGALQSASNPQVGGGLQKKSAGAVKSQAQAAPHSQQVLSQTLTPE